MSTAQSRNRSAAFIGTGSTRFARSIPHRTLVSLLVEAIYHAVEDAGLEKNDVDGLIATFSSDAHTIAEHAGMTPLKLCMNNETGSGGAGFAVDVARWALMSGRCTNVVLVCGARESMTGRSRVGSGFLGRLMEGEAISQGHFQDMDQIFGVTWLNQYAAQARRHMFEYGTTVEQLAAVAVSNRYNASLNPDAVYRTPISIDEVLDSKLISDPFTMLMCAMVNDGAAAAVLTTAERARATTDRPVHVLGTGDAFTGYTPTKVAGGDPSGRFDLVRTVGSLAAEEAFGRAGVTASDIDFIESSEHFVSSQIFLLEDYGFCSKGEGGPFIGDGTRTMIGGTLPFNTYGGESSGTHASSSHGALIEAIRQLQGRCGARQVKGAKVGLFASTCGKVSTHSLVVLGAD